MNQDIEERISRLQTEIDVLTSIKKNLYKQDQDSTSSTSEILGSCKDILDNLDYKIIEYKCRGINTSSNGSSKSGQDNSNNTITSETETTLKSNSKCECKNWIFNSFPTYSSPNADKKKNSLKSLYINDRIRPKSAVEREKRMRIESKGVIKKPGTAPTRVRTIKSLKPRKISRADFQFDSKLLGYGLINSDFHDRCCKYKKILEETIKDTNNKIDDLQVQFDDSHANIEFLSAGRNFLIKTLDVLKTKYFNLKDAYNNVCDENKKLKQENKKFVSNIPDIEKSCDEFHECQLLVLRLQDENLKLQKTIWNVKEIKNKMFDALKRQKVELESENCKLKYQINLERSKHLLSLTQFESKLLKFISLEQNNRDSIKKLRTVINDLKLSNKLKKCDDADIGKELCCMKVECSTLKKYVSYLKYQDERKMGIILTELSNYQNVLTKNEDLITIEKNGILSIIDNLSNMVFTHRKRIEQLIDVNKKLGTLVTSQHTLLSRKEEEISNAEKIIQSAVQQTINLNQVINALEMSLSVSEYFSSSMLSIISKKNDTSCCKGIEFIQRDLISIRSNLEEEKHKLAIKDKIISDQADTIRSLKISRSKQTSGSSSEKEIFNVELQDIVSDYTGATKNSSCYSCCYSRTSSERGSVSRNKISDQTDTVKNSTRSSFEGEKQKRLLHDESSDRTDTLINSGSYKLYCSRCSQEGEKIGTKDGSDRIDTTSTLVNYSFGDSQTSFDKSRILKKIDSMKLLKKKLLDEIKELEKKRNCLLKNVLDINNGNELTTISSVDLDRKIDEQYKILKQLEDEVANKQEEWVKQQAIMYNEKMQAIEIARFATDKLLETMIEFQKHTFAQKEARDKVVEIINKKFPAYNVSACGGRSIQTLYKAPMFSSSDLYDTDSVRMN